MHLSSLLIVAALGVTFGWQPAKDDPRAYEVTAQIEPELLDALKAGRTVPIESHVPAEVNPIRNIRVVVGKDALPRTALKPIANPDRIVRGQGDVPQNHTTLLAADDGWSTTQYSTGNTPAAADSRRYEQRNATIGSDTLQAAQSVSPWDRTQTAATETGSVLRDGVEAGIQQANQQASQVGGRVVEGANDLTRGFNQGLQNLSNTAQGQLKSVWPAPPPSVATSAANSTMRTAQVPTAPPLNTPAPSLSAPVAPATGWSIVRSDAAPPRLLMPPLINAPATAATISPATIGGPAFPATNQSRTPFHSVLVDPATQAAQPPASNDPSQPNWSQGWGSPQSDANSTLPLRNGPQIPTASATDNRYAQTPAPGAVQDPWANWAKSSPVAASPTNSNQPPLNPAAPAVQSNVAPPAANPANPQFIGYGNAANPTQQPAAPPSEVPWKPLLAVSLALAGSLGANLFLGWSYADARHRYHALARKTTNSFQRAVGAAA